MERLLEGKVALVTGSGRGLGRPAPTFSRGKAPVWQSSISTGPAARKPCD